MLPQHCKEALLTAARAFNLVHSGLNEATHADVVSPLQIYGYFVQMPVPYTAAVQPIEFSICPADPFAC
jgi:hypothetical protein